MWKIKFVVNILIFLLMCLAFVLWIGSAFQMDFISLKSQSGNSIVDSIEGLKIGIDSVLLTTSCLLLLYFIKGTKYLEVTIVLMAALLVNSVIYGFTNGFSSSILILMGVISFIVLMLRWIVIKFPTLRDYMDEVHPDFRAFRFVQIGFQFNWRKRLINKMLSQKYEAAKTFEEVKIRQHTIKGYEGRDIRVEVFELEDATDDSPCIIVYPGGAFWAKPIQTYKYIFGRYIKGTSVKIVFIHYTLSIDAPFPVAIEDCYLGTLWAYNNAELIGINKDKIMLYGISSGGTMVASITQMLRDRGAFKPCFQMLIYPALDDRMNTISAIKYRGMPGWKTGMLEDAITYYTRDGMGENPAYAVPMKATDFSNLPDAFIEVAEYDCVRDEAIIYGEELEKHGTKVEYVEIKGAVHGFDIILKSKISKKAIQKRIEVMNKIFYEN